MNEDIKKRLWAAADRLRNQMDAAEYKHIVLGLIFLKYISDRFDQRQAELRDEVSNPQNEETFIENEKRREAEIEERDNYESHYVFWVPREARWENLRALGKQSDIGERIDEALLAIERENTSLKGKLDKRFGRTQLESGVLGELIDLFSPITFEGSDSGDLLGDVYEYFLGQFASAEGKKGGQFYTPASVVRTLVEVLSPYKGRVYDPCCGSGGMFVQSERFVKEHKGLIDDISIYGQESNPTTWRLAAMNIAIRGFYADLGGGPADTFAKDQFPNKRFDYILANPPFNVSEWNGEHYQDDPRWRFGVPPAGNANYAWLQHILWKLRPEGSAGVVLANGSMSSQVGGEGEIRQKMIEGDVVEAMVALPSQLFINTQIPACLWFMTNDKKARLVRDHTKNGQEYRDRRGETLFIDARGLGSMASRVWRVLSDDDIDKIARTVHNWRTGDGYEDEAGFCRSGKRAEIEKHGFVLTPGRYVGAQYAVDDGVPFAEKMQTLTEQLAQQMEKSEDLDDNIRKQLGRIGYEI